MYQNFFSEYLVKVQEANAHWWKNWEANKQALNSPVNNALREINFDDTAKLLEQAGSQPTSSHCKVTISMVGETVRNLAKYLS